MHVRCPHCQNPIEIVGEHELKDISCPSCGSNFNLLHETESWSPTPQWTGHFQLLDKLGTGGFGTVWKARDTKLDRLVAVKIPRRAQVSSAEEEQFLREARAAAQLRHPSIVAVHEVGRQESGDLYIVSDFVQGTTLADRLTAGPFTPREAAELTAQIADALHHAHEQGVIHRDLKPSNIMLERSESMSSGNGDAPPDASPLTTRHSPARDTVKLLDFGLAKREAGEITMTVDGKVLGTPAYMSPEQARGEGHNVDRRTDIYSLGVILFECLTGELPFRGNTRMLLDQVLHDDPPSPRKLNGRIPRDLETICLKCLEKERQRRYVSADDVAQELRRWRAGKPILARPISSLERGVRWSQRNPLVASLSCAIVLALVLGTVFSSTFAILASRRATAEATQRTRADGETARANQASQQAKDESQKAKTSADTARAEAERAYRLYYDAEMSLAQRDWELNDLRSLIRRLERTKEVPPGLGDLRSFEWYYWDRMCHSELLRLDGQWNNLTCVAFSPDGTRIVGGGGTDTHGMVHAWDATTGRTVFSVEAHAGRVKSLGFSHDGTRIVSGGNDGKVKVLDSGTGAEILGFSAATLPVTAVEFSPSDEQIVSGSEDQFVNIWNSVNGERKLSIKAHPEGVTCVAFSPDGTTIASAGIENMLGVLTPSEEAIKLWNASDGTERLGFSEHGDIVRCLAFNKEGTRLVSGGDDLAVRVWDTNSGRLLHTLHGHTRSPFSYAMNRIYGVAFSPDGTRIASGGSDQVVKLWDTTRLEPLFEFKGPFAPANAVAFNHDGTRLANAAYYCVNVWDVTAPPARREMLSDGMIGLFDLRAPLAECVAFSHDGTRLVSAAWGRGSIWDARLGTEVAQLAGSPLCVAFNHDDSAIVGGTGHGSLEVFHSGTGVRVRSLPGHTDDVITVAFNFDGTRFVSGSRDHKAKLWDFRSGRELATMVGHSGSVNSVAFSPNGKRIATASADQSVRVWDADTATEVLSFQEHQTMVDCLAWSIDGTRIASGDSSGVVKLWNAVNGKDIITLRDYVFGTNTHSSLAFSPDGKRLAYGCGSTSTMTIWDSANGQEVLGLRTSGGITSLAFGPDSKRLAVAMHDPGLYIWGLVPGIGDSP